MSDWRLDLVAHLRGLRWRYGAWSSASASSDHDHCAACGAKFSLSLGAVAAGYATGGYATGADYRHGAAYEWLCADCFHDLKTEMGWSEERP